MSIQSISNNTYTYTPANNNNISGQNLPDKNAKSSTEIDVSQEFLNYMQLSPQQRMEEEWLRQHGLSRAKLAEMSPAERQSVMSQMRHDIEQQVRMQSLESSQGKLDMVV